ncbi:esterase [Nodosilinea sp. P-1105]|uniref:alpha/beta hydrolase n=1 Tax=Nodosilinea sp. P-1105 TaxID=2546229 RepID=UPI00146BDB2C|nr:esterase [Nodosilinea sp. P-1105]NMF82669.1 esterase [Nodosilinea sp. P-1105]
MLSTLQALAYPAPGETPTDLQLVILHGWGASAADLAGLAPYLQLTNTAMVFPDAPLPHPQVPGGRMWYGFPAAYDFRTPPDFEAQADLQTSRQQLTVWLADLADTSQIPLERTVLAGFSQGGAMTLDVGGQLPLAGQICLSGYLHGTARPPMSPRPLLMVHGSFDPVVPIEQAHRARAALDQQGQPVTFQELPMGHEVTPQTLQIMAGFCEDLRQTL